MSCSGLTSSYAVDSSLMGFGGPNPMFSYYYNSGPEYVFENSEVNGQERLIFNENEEDVSQFYNHADFIPYNRGGCEEFDSDTTTLGSYHTEFDYDSQFQECQLLMEEELRDLSTTMDQSSSSSVHFHQEQIQMQIRRNEELAHQLSPIRKCQEQMQSQQTRKNAENARRKFSLTNGIRPKQRQSNPSSPATKSTKLSVSVRRWQSEILAKLPLSQQKRDAMVSPPNVDAPQERQMDGGGWQPATVRHFPGKPVPPQRRSSLQTPQWSQLKEEEYYCCSR